MPQQTLNHARLNIVEAGAGPETQVLLHGLLFSHRMFDAQVDALQSRFRCVSTPGQPNLSGMGSNFSLQSLVELRLRTQKIVARLQIEPELCLHAKVPAQAQCRIGRNRSFALA